MSNAYEITGYIEEADGRAPFYLKISAPALTEDADDYYCSVHAPYLLQNDKNIIGIDEEQAKELAINFVKSMLSGKLLVDDNGRIIELTD